MTNGETHESTSRQQIEVRQDIPKQRLQDKGEKPRAEADARRRTTLSVVLHMMAGAALALLLYWALTDNE